MKLENAGDSTAPKLLAAPNVSLLPAITTTAVDLAIFEGAMYLTNAKQPRDVFMQVLKVSDLMSYIAHCNGHMIRDYARQRLPQIVAEKKALPSYGYSFIQFSNSFTEQFPWKPQPRQAILA